jgi:histidine decarboxylase
MKTGFTNRKSLKKLMNTLKNANELMIGYPVAKDFDFSELYPSLKYVINNVGDPFIESTYKVQTHKTERKVIDFFAQLLRANPKDYWGYVTTGGSEGNLYGLYVARERYPNAMVYYSETTHYSIKKNIHLLNIPSIVIRSQENGEIDYEDLQNTLLNNRHIPPIIMANFGTTMKEAKDDVSKIKSILKILAIKSFHIHLDGALSASYGNFIEPRIPYDLQDGTDSISLSGHKFIGSPFPCGIVITKRSFRDRIANDVAYIGSLDTTIAGSRNGHAVLFMWYAINKMGVEGLRKRYEDSLKMASYCKEELKKSGISAWSNPGAITIVFPKTSEKLTHKWGLAAEGDITHIICMPSISKEQIDNFIIDLLEEKNVNIS